METLEKLQNETTYIVIDQASNRFNFCGLPPVNFWNISIDIHKTNLKKKY